MENWKKFLLDEGIANIDDLPDGAIYIEGGKSHHRSQRIYTCYLIIDGRKAGSLGVDNVEYSFSDHSDEAECEDLKKELKNLYTIHRDLEPFAIGKGYGALLTEIAMDLAVKDGKKIIPAALTSNGYLSEDGKKMFDYWFNRYTDVSVEEFDPGCWEIITGMPNKVDEYWRWESVWALYSRKGQKILPKAGNKIRWG